jgi:hypothetical protein
MILQWILKKYGKLNSSCWGHEPIVGTWEQGIKCLGFTKQD